MDKKETLSGILKGCEDSTQLYTDIFLTWQINLITSKYLLYAALNSAHTYTV